MSQYMKMLIGDSIGAPAPVQKQKMPSRNLLIWGLPLWGGQQALEGWSKMGIDRGE